MVQALVIYDTFTGHTRLIAEKIKKRLEEIGIKVLADPPVKGTP